MKTLKGIIKTEVTYDDEMKNKQIPNGYKAP